MLRTIPALILATALLPTDVAACSCGGPRNALEARSATLVLRGRIVRVEYRELRVPPLDGSWERYREPVEVEIEVTRSWNGRAKRTTMLYTGMGGGDCGYGFVVGMEYLIPVYESPVGELNTGICGGVQTLWEARRVLPLLGPGQAPLPSIFEGMRPEHGRSWATLLMWHAVLSAFVTLVVAVQVGLSRQGRT
jgi:hypothetical protein